MILQGTTATFKPQLMLGCHDFRPMGDIFKIALYTGDANLTSDTLAYTDVGEVVAVGYDPGGIALTNLGVRGADGVGFTSFEDVSWVADILGVRGALIYNSTPSAPDGEGGTLINPAVCVLDFGSDKKSTMGVFTIQFPPMASGSAIIRLQ